MTRILGVPPVGPSEQDTEEEDPFETITDEDRYKADEEMVKELYHYAGYTLLIVIVLLVIVFCFATDPRACIVAFGTGSPCCLLCPCVKNLYKYTDPAKLIKDSVNIYVPGILIEDDMSISTYEPSEEEHEILFELINEITTM